MSAETLLSRLEGVREVRSGDWYAKCPAHDDRSPSLHVTEIQDGTILIYDFGGCSPAEVLHAVGLQLSDLFPDKLEYKPGNRKAKVRASALDLLRLLSHSATVLMVFLEDTVEGKSISDTDLKIVHRAYRDMQTILREAHL